MSGFFWFWFPVEMIPLIHSFRIILFFVVSLLILTFLLCGELFPFVGLGVG